jgi:hypothetical protein
LAFSETNLESREGDRQNGDKSDVAVDDSAPKVVVGVGIE